MYVSSSHNMTYMEKTQVYLREEELASVDHDSVHDEP
jgi:hypothetical protein